MPNNPLWKSEFPVRQSEEHAVSRRQFCKAACLATAGVGAGWMARDGLFPHARGQHPMRIALVSEIPVGGYRLFRYPTDDHPAILIRPSRDQFAAYSQACTHLMCPVHYQREKNRFYCPCHEGFFSAVDGHVLAGPPRRPLPRFPVELRDGEIWVTPGQPGKEAIA